MRNRLGTGFLALLLLLAAAAVGTAALGTAGMAAAADYPERPIIVVVGFPPGGASDILARIITNKLSSLLGQPVIVDNRPGAGGNVAGDVVAHAAPDGYTLLSTSLTTYALNPNLYKKLP